MVETIVASTQTVSSSFFALVVLKSLIGMVIVLAVITKIVVDVLKRIPSVNSASVKRMYPVLAVVLSVVISVALHLATKASIGQAFEVGFLAGFGAIALHDIIKSIKGNAVTEPKPETSVVSK